MSTERTPLLSSYFHGAVDDLAADPHAQFCMLVGVPSSAPTPDGKKRSFSPPPKSLYGRATRQLSNQRFTYHMTASLSNTMLLSQVVLGAALTALGASESSHILITVFGAMNTIIAGLVAYLKSRGQPMRARMYRDDLERVVDEIENSEVMWLGISRGVHGYDEIDTDEHQVTVRSEVARLTRLYDRAVRNNTVNNPDMYMAGGYDSNGTTLRSRPVVGGLNTAPVPIAAGPQPVIAAPVLGVDPALPAVTPGPVPPVTVPDPDESPVTAKPKPKVEAKKEDEEDEDKGKEKEEKRNEEEENKRKEKEKEESTSIEQPPSSQSSVKKSNGGEGTQLEPSTSTPQPPPPPPAQERDPDASPASDPNVPLKRDKEKAKTVNEES